MSFPLIQVSENEQGLVIVLSREAARQVAPFLREIIDKADILLTENDQELLTETNNAISL